MERLKKHDLDMVGSKPDLAVAVSDIDQSV